MVLRLQPLTNSYNNGRPLTTPLQKIIMVVRLKPLKDSHDYRRPLAIIYLKFIMVVLLQPLIDSYDYRRLPNSKESLLESSICHTVILMTLSLSIIKDLRSSFLIFTPKNSQFLKQQNLPQLFPISIYFSSEIKATI